MKFVELHQLKGPGIIPKGYPGTDDLKLFKYTLFPEHRRKLGTEAHDHDPPPAARHLNGLLDGAFPTVDLSIRSNTFDDPIDTEAVCLCQDFFHRIFTVALIVRSAPIFWAISRRLSSTSTAHTQLAAVCLMTSRTASPRRPAPRITTRSPGSIIALRAE